MSHATFTRMIDGTQADYDAVVAVEEAYNRGLVDRVLQAVRDLDAGAQAYAVTRYEHSLQSATRASRDGRDDEYVVAALLHDIGDGLAPHTHGEFAAAVLRPFVRPELQWIVAHHGAFQLHYYGRYTGGDPDAREHFRDHEWFDACEEFCLLYDQESFDPSYDSEPLAAFESAVRRVFGAPRHLGNAAAY
jgi:predicted HD phosphohydrolase